MQAMFNPRPLAAEQPNAPEIVSADIERRLAWQRLQSRFDLLWTARRVLFWWVLAGLVIGTVVAFLIPSRYESSTRLMPPDSEPSGALALVAGLTGRGASDGLGAMAGDLLGMKSTGDLFIGVLKSRTVQDRIVQRFDLKKVYRFRLEIDATQKLMENTSISADRKSGIITVTVTDHNPGRAAAIAGAYVEELDTLMAQLTTSSAHRERVFLESRLNGVTQDLESVEKEFSQFASKNATIDVTEQGKAVVESAAMLDGQLIATESQLEGLRQIYNENNVRVRATKARVNELRSELQKMTGKAGVDSAANGSQPGDAYPSLRQLPILGVRYADLFRHLKVQEAVFETLTKEYELAKVQEAKEIPTVKVLDAPDVPEKKSFPPRALFISLGALCALGLGISWVLGTARWQAIDSQDPRKIFARRVVVALRAEMPWVSRNGSGSSVSAEDSGSATHGGEANGP